jgi:hypothetical protein
MEDVAVEFGNYLKIIIPIVMAMLILIWTVLPKKRKYSIQLTQALTGPRYSFALGKGKTGIPGKLPGD